MDMIRKSSPHCERRKSDMRPLYIVLHYTAVPAQLADSFFMGECENGAGQRVSAHYMVSEGGAVTQYVDEELRAWHAGLSYWRGERDMNSASIGVELVHEGHAAEGTVPKPYPAEQMEALVTLCRDIMARWDIPAGHVIGHSDIAPGRKIDPGEFFDWQGLAGQGIGVWPEPTAEQEALAMLHEGDEAYAVRLMQAYGYDPAAEPRSIITAFQLHFVPEIFADGQHGRGYADKLTLARLIALVSERDDESAVAV